MDEQSGESKEEEMIGEGIDESEIENEVDEEIKGVDSRGKAFNAIQIYIYIVVTCFLSLITDGVMSANWLINILYIKALNHKMNRQTLPPFLGTFYAKGKEAIKIQFMNKSNRNSVGIFSASDNYNVVLGEYVCTEWRCCQWWLCKEPCTRLVEVPHGIIDPAVHSNCWQSVTRQNISSSFTLLLLLLLLLAVVLIGYNFSGGETVIFKLQFCTYSLSSFSFVVSTCILLHWNCMIMMMMMMMMIDDDK